ncbi:MAG: GFA family protein [Pseudomonadota bacterium]
MTERSGGCLCGAVRLRAVLSDEVIGACHCIQCQRWTGGGPLLSVPVSAVTFTHEDRIREFSISEWGVRAVCADCGTPLYWRMSDGPVKHVTVGLLDDQTGLAVTEEIFVDYRAPWLDAVPGAAQSTEAEQNALLKAYLDKRAEGSTA